DGSGLRGPALERPGQPQSSPGRSGLIGAGEGGWDDLVCVRLSVGRACAWPVAAAGAGVRGSGAVAEQAGLGFARLLRQLRTEAELTQEELAEAADLSPRSVSDLERGVHRTARKDTALLLAGALGLAEPARALFVAAARGHGPTASVLAAVHGEATGAAAAAATKTLPGDIAAFTGRQGELTKLLDGSASRGGDGGRAGVW